MNSKSTWLSPGARVTAIEISGVDADRSPARLDVRFGFTGRWQRDSEEADTDFVGFMTLNLDGAGSQPWRLTAGYLQRLSSWLGYQFTSRQETPEEHQQRTGSATAPGPVAGQDRTFRLTAGFAEHDKRYGGSASVQVTRPIPPSRAEAEALIWPAVEAATEQALGPGDWRPSLNWLEVIELLPGPARASERWRRVSRDRTAGSRSQRRGSRPRSAMVVGYTPADLGSRPGRGESSQPPLRRGDHGQTARP